MNILACKIDVKENEEEVLDFLHSNNVFESGRILSPTKDLWFKHSHYLQLHFAPCTWKQKYYYTYITKNKQFQGEYLKDITLDELKIIIK